MKNDVDTTDITSVVQRFMDDPAVTNGNARALSWDFCFNYFSDLERVKKDREASCMQLGYYLASWGMLRGSTYLFKNTNARHYLQVLDVIERYTPEMHHLHPSTFGEQSSQDILVATYKELESALLPKGRRGITLVTKVMMGVWGVFPSLDSYFMQTFKPIAESRGKRAGFTRFGVNTVELIGEFYCEHQKEIDRLATTYQTVDFTSGRHTERSVPAAKIIDIYGFGTSYYR